VPQASRVQATMHNHDRVESFAVVKDLMLLFLQHKSYKTSCSWEHPLDLSMQISMVVRRPRVPRSSSSCFRFFSLVNSARPAMTCRLVEGRFVARWRWKSRGESLPPVEVAFFHMSIRVKYNSVNDYILFSG